MTLKAYTCVVCGGPLKHWFNGEICSAKCRKKKSRDKLEAGRRAAAIGFDIDKLSVSIGKGYFTKEEAEELLYAINGRLWAMRDAINAIGEPKFKPQEDDNE